MLYRNLPEFFKTEEKAVLFLTWPQTFLALSGLLLGGLLSGKVGASPLGNVLFTLCGGLLGLGLGVIRLDRVPLYQVIGAFARYWWRRLRDGHPPVVAAADRWPGEDAMQQGPSLWVQEAGGPVIQIAPRRK